MQHLSRGSHSHYVSRQDFPQFARFLLSLVRLAWSPPPPPRIQVRPYVSWRRNNKIYYCNTRSCCAGCKRRTLHQVQLPHRAHAGFDLFPPPFLRTPCSHTCCKFNFPLCCVVNYGDAVDKSEVIANTIFLNLSENRFGFWLYVFTLKWCVEQNIAGFLKVFITIISPRQFLFRFNI